MVRFVKHIESLIDKDPYLYLAYIFHAEYFCVLCGPDMIQSLEEKCGYPENSMTIVGNHSELDKEHIVEWEEIIETLVDAKTYQQPFIDVIKRTTALHGAFLANCAGVKLDVAS